MESSAFVVAKVRSGEDERRMYVTTGFATDRDVEVAARVVVDTYAAVGLLDKFRELTRAEGIEDHLRRVFSSHYTVSARVSGVCVIYEKPRGGQGGPCVPAGILSCLPLFDCMGVPKAVEILPYVSIPRVQPLPSSKAQQGHMGWYDSTRTALMLSGVRLVAEALGDSWPVLHHSTYFTAGAVREPYQKTGASRTAFEACIEAAKARGNIMGWGYCINPGAMPMNGSLRNGYCRVVGWADLHQLAATGGQQDRPLNPGLVVQDIGQRLRPGVWTVWVIIFDFYRLTGETFPKCPDKRPAVEASSRL